MKKLTQTELRKLVNRIFVMKNVGDYILVHAHPFKDSFDFIPVGSPIDSVNLERYGVNYNEHGVSLYMSLKERQHNEN